MEVTADVAREQARLWNGPAGRAWVESQELLDHVLAPFENILVGEVLTAGACRVLDIGCGTGATTLAVARRLGARGRVSGIDLSAPMLGLARERARLGQIDVEFIEADAQTHPFAEEHFDMLISRFGVMFFAEPVRAFDNLRRTTRAGGRLAAIAFRRIEENPFMTTAERAAAPLLPRLPPRCAGPGQFAFADAAQVCTILERAGWANVHAEPLDVVCTLPERELLPYISRLGPVGLALAESDEATRTRVLAAVRQAFEPYVHGNEVCFTAACWLYRALARPGR